MWAFYLLLSPLGPIWYRPVQVLGMWEFLWVQMCIDPAVRRACFYVVSIPSDSYTLCASCSMDFPDHGGRDLIGTFQLVATSVPRKPLNNPGCCQVYDFLSTTWHSPITEDNVYTIHWTNWCLHRTFTAMGLCSCYWTVVCMLLKEKYKHQSN